MSVFQVCWDELTAEVKLHSNIKEISHGILRNIQVLQEFTNFIFIFVHIHTYVFKSVLPFSKFFLCFDLCSGSSVYVHPFGHDAGLHGDLNPAEILAPKELFLSFSPPFLPF